MIEKLFPKTADNTYHGHWLAKWLLIFYTVKSFVAGSIHMFTADGGAQSIASITLDQFTQEGADSVVTIFGLWGMEQFVIGRKHLGAITGVTSTIGAIASGLGPPLYGIGRDLAGNYWPPLFASAFYPATMAVLVLLFLRRSRVE